MVRKFLSGALMLFLTPWLYAQSGEYIYSFLNLPVSVSASGLGGNSVSSQERDLNLIFQNPAFLDADMHQIASVGYMNYLSDVKLGSLAYARKVDDNSAWMSGLRYINYGSMVWTNAQGEVLGETYAGDMALTGGYSFHLNERWRAGASINLIYSVLDEYTSFGLTTDLGLYYFNPEQNFSMGFVARNLGAQLAAYDETYEKMPWDLQLGFSKKLAHAPLRFTATMQALSNPDITYLNENDATSTSEGTLAAKIFRHTLLGVEFIPNSNFVLSLGYNYRRLNELSVAQRTFFSGFSAGFALRVKSTRIGASVARYHLAGTSLQMTYALDLSKFKK